MCSVICEEQAAVTGDVGGKAKQKWRDLGGIETVAEL